jgi:hypothetical protein
MSQRCRRGDIGPGRAAAAVWRGGGWAVERESCPVSGCCLSPIAHASLIRCATVPSSQQFPAIVAHFHYSSALSRLLPACHGLLHCVTLLSSRFPCSDRRAAAVRQPETLSERRASQQTSISITFPSTPRDPYHSSFFAYHSAIDSVQWCSPAAACIVSV